MLIKSKDLLKLPVETKSGKLLGAVCGMEIDIDTHQIKKYYVKPSGLVKGLIGDVLIIDFSQVLSVTKERMIVEDGVSKKRILIVDPVIE